MFGSDSSAILAYASCGLGEGNTLTSCAVDLSLANPANIWRPLHVASVATGSPVTCLSHLIQQW